MSLPKLNTLTYELELPSTGEKLKYRPFLVKEQKALMIAQETEDDKLLENTFAQIISDCVLDDIDPYTMPMFDIEYVFLRIRGKSVGEKVKLNLLCPDDEKTRVNVEIDLEKVDVQMSEDHTNIVNLTKDIKLIMRYPRLRDMTGFDDKGEVSSIFDMIKRCVHEIHDGKTVYNKVDISEKELDEFIDSMSTENFENLSAFFETMPKLFHEIEVKNPKTKKKTKIPIEGLQSFFV
ncbi:baseplate protein [Candidatus Pacearchaeota archaeon]|nr:baseplate protein [Candidatus Pacearchaeota archaeon]|tara:strand:- start:453 stop:1157 length:705 start_codon:yes stop_codon:yes gene_type:complete